MFIFMKKKNADVILEFSTFFFPHLLIFPRKKILILIPHSPQNTDFVSPGPVWSCANKAMLAKGTFLDLSHEDRLCFC